MMVPVAGPLIRCTHVSTVPVRPQSPTASDHDQLARRTKRQELNIKGYHVRCQPFPVSVNLVVSLTQDNLFSGKLLVMLVQTSLSSIMDTLQQDLFSPSKVTLVDAEKLWPELYVHSDQTQVDYVTSGLNKRFRLGFNHLAVSSSMPSLSLQPSVIDQCLLIELEKGRVAGRFLTSCIPNLNVNLLLVYP